MKTSTLRRLDLLLGAPACAFLSSLRRLSGHGEAAAAPSRILFLKLAEQGATVLALAAFRRGAEISGPDGVLLLTFAGNRELATLLGVIPERNILTVDLSTPATAALTALRALREVRRRRVDAVVDLEFFSRTTAALGFLTGAPLRAGLHATAGEGPWRGDLFTRRVRHSPYLHASQTFRLLVEALLAPTDRFPALELPVPPLEDVPSLFAPSPAERDAARQLLEDAGIPAGAHPLVILNPNLSDPVPLRRWPAERFVELARRLVGRHPAGAVLFTGPPEETAASRGLAAGVASRRCASAAGTTGGIRNLLALHRRADVLVTSDCGPAHFATLAGLPTVVLFGPETPAVFGPLSPRCHPIRAGLPCSPCLSALNNRVSSCSDNLCMQGIAVEGVLSAVEALLETAEARGEGRTA